MRVLLDECVPRACATTLSATVTRQFAKMGWAGVKNGQRLRLAAGQFDAMLTSTAMSNTNRILLACRLP
jgi:hypothetical protein